MPRVHNPYKRASLFVFVAALITLISLAILPSSFLKRTLTSALAESASSASTIPWAMLGRDAQHTGKSSFLGPQILDIPEILNIELGRGMQSSIVIDGNGILYALSQGQNEVSKIYAINPDGSVREGWPFTALPGSQSSHSLAIAPDGTIHAAIGKYVYALNANGSAKWPDPFVTGDNNQPSPIVGSDSTVYVSSGDSYLYAINPDGTQKWRVFGFSGYVPPAIGPDGTIYASGGPTLLNTGGVTALNPDGSIKWATARDCKSLVVSDEGTIYGLNYILPSGTTTLLGLAPTNGAVVYQREVTQTPYLALQLAITPNGTVLYAPIQDQNKLFGFSPDLSTVRFEYSFSDSTVPSNVVTNPAIGSDGTIYVAIGTTNPNAASRVVALSQDGVLKSEFTIEASLGNRPTAGAISSDGTLYFGTSCCAENSGKIYAFAGPPQPPPTPSITPTPTVTPTPSPTATPTPTVTPTPTPAPSKRPVVLIHGTGASRLGVGSPSPLRQGWPGDVLKLKIGNPENLQFTENGQPRTDTISSQLAAVDILDVPKEKDMNDLIAFLGEMGYARDEHTFAFLYDFRFPIKTNAVALKVFIRDIKNKTGAQKVDIVAHSMGGLVAKQYLRESANASNVETFVMLGTPQLGLPKALKVLRYGDELSSILDKCKVKRAAHNMPGFFNMLPGRRYFEVAGGYFFDEADIDGDGITGRLSYDQMVYNLRYGLESQCLLKPGIDAEPHFRLSSQLVEKQFEDFHDERDYWSKPVNVKTFVIAGHGINTLVLIRETNDKTSKRIDLTCSPQGDGTVPLKSAEMSEADAVYYADFSALGTNHSEMVGNFYVQLQVMGLLQAGDNIYVGNMSKVRPTYFKPAKGNCD